MHIAHFGLVEKYDREYILPEALKFTFLSKRLVSQGFENKKGFVTKMLQTCFSELLFPDVTFYVIIDLNIPM